MNCREFTAQLESAIERRDHPSEESQHHAATCPNEECRNRWEELRLLDAAIQLWRHDHPRIDFTERVIREELEFDDVEILGSGVRRQTRSDASQWSGMLAATATALAVASLLIAVVWKAPQEELANIQPEPHERVVVANAPRPPHVTPEEEEQLRELGKQYASLMQGASAKLTDAVVAVLPGQDMMPDGMDPTSSWLNTWGERLEPLEQKLDQTLREFMNNAMSSGEEQTS